jgi:GDPmannose 4,6-dehydratase
MSEIKNKTKKKALITGITGQDGSYLAEFLLYKGYEVHGIVRRSSTFNTERIDHIYQDPHDENIRIFGHYGDLTDSGNLQKIINEVKPDEVYHLGAMSHVRVSFDMPEYTANTGALGTLRILEAIKNSGLSVKFYNAASSEMFGSNPPPQNENTPFHPRSPYAISKVFSFHTTQFYREAYGVFACNGMLFNHESPRRGGTFVTKKITHGISKIKAGIEKKIYLGNLEAKRDWGFAPEYIEAMWMILQQEKPDDYVISTGESHSVAEFLEAAFKYSGLGDWHNYVEFDPRYLRPAEVESLIGDNSKAKKELNWQPKIKFEDLVKIMVDADFRSLNIAAPGEGDNIIKDKFPEKWWKKD